jgi:hypothetical protein
MVTYVDRVGTIRYTIPTLSAYVTMRRLCSSDIQYRPYLHMLPWDDSADGRYCISNWLNLFLVAYVDRVGIVYLIEWVFSWAIYVDRVGTTLSTYVTKRRLSQSDIQYRPYLHMLSWEDSINQIYNTDPIYIYYPWEDSVNQIYNTDPIYLIDWVLSW